MLAFLSVWTAFSLMSQGRQELEIRKLLKALSKNVNEFLANLRKLVFLLIKDALQSNLFDLNEILVNKTFRQQKAVNKKVDSMKENKGIKPEENTRNESIPDKEMPMDSSINDLYKNQRRNVIDINSEDQKEAS